MAGGADIPELARKSLLYRRRLLEAIYHAGTGHTGGSLSCVDILNVLYNRILRVSPENFDDPHRDRYVQSKGHSVEALYVVLADQGFFPFSDLESMSRYQSPYVGHPTRKVRGIEQNTGALGHGLPFSVGLALGAKLNTALESTPRPILQPKPGIAASGARAAAGADGDLAASCSECRAEGERAGLERRSRAGDETTLSADLAAATGAPAPLPPSLRAPSPLATPAFRVFTLLGDGELAEGSNWEAAMAAAHYKLDNLTAIVDCNDLQITGRTSDVMNHEPLRPKFEAFGWAVREVDGHDLAALIAALEAPLAPGQPSAVIARTIKGKGISFMEKNASWHHRVPTAEEFARAMTELGGADGPHLSRAESRAAPSDTAQPSTP